MPGPHPRTALRRFPLVLVDAINSWAQPPGLGYVFALRLRAQASPYLALARRLGSAA